MRVSLGTIEVSDEVRAAWRKRTGKTGLATRKEIRRAVLSLWDGFLPDLLEAEEGADDELESDPREARPLPGPEGHRIVAPRRLVKLMRQEYGYDNEAAAIAAYRRIGGGRARNAWSTAYRAEMRAALKRRQTQEVH